MTDTILANSCDFSLEEVIIEQSSADRREGAVVEVVHHELGEYPKRPKTFWMRQDLISHVLLIFLLSFINSLLASVA